MTQILEFGQGEVQGETVVKGITAILYDAKTDKIGCLHDSHNHGDYWLICGGIDTDENYVECAKREIIEETGYNDFGEISSIVPMLYSRFFHPKKQKNIRGEVRPYFVELKSMRNIGTSLEEHEKGFEMAWVTVDDIRNSLFKTGESRFGKGGYDHWLFLLDEVEKILSKNG